MEEAQSSSNALEAGANTRANSPNTLRPPPVVNHESMVAMGWDHVNPCTSQTAFSEVDFDTVAEEVNGSDILMKSTILVDTEPLLWEMLAVLHETLTLPLMEPSLYMDGEGGPHYGKGGSPYPWQIYVKPANVVYIIDVLTMGSLAFSSRHPTLELSLRNILESDRLMKGFWDVWKDSEMLLGHGVELSADSVIDLQLFEVASSTEIEHCMNFGSAVAQMASLGQEELRAFGTPKTLERKFFGPAISQFFGNDLYFPNSSPIAQQM